jgi:hypothetical protein
MRVFALAIAFGLLATAASAQQDAWAKIKAAKAQAPADVASYMDRRMGCEHFAGEPAYDAERRAYLEKMFAELECTTLKADEAALRRKYQGNPAALQAMDLVKDGVL